jgi:hypothetical protein
MTAPIPDGEGKLEDYLMIEDATGLEAAAQIDSCCGLPLRLVEAISSSCRSFIDLYIDFEAPLSSLTFFSPRFAERAAPAAICWALDFTGVICLTLRVWTTQGLPSRQGVMAAFSRDSRDNVWRTRWSLRARGMRLA